MTKPTLIIIGAGASGLIAASELAAFYEVTVLEAGSRIGGRIFSARHKGILVEAGAEFVHGNLPITLGLLKEAGIEVVKVSGKMFRHENEGFVAVEEMTEGWDGLLKKMETAEDDMSMLQLLDKNYSSPRYKSLRRQVTKYLEGFDLADVARASVQATLKEWKAEEEDNYRIPSGYQSLLEYLNRKLLTDGVIVQTSTPVQTVRWEQGKVILSTAGGKEFVAAKLLVTVPVSMLLSPAKKSSIRFEPPLPFGESIANQFGFGAVIKLVLKFKEPFWQTGAGFIFSEEIFPTWWTQLPDPVPMLTGWLGGPQALALSAVNDEELLTKGLFSLANIYSVTLADLRQNLEWAKVFNWQKVEYIRGGYSYATTGTSAAQKIFSTPVEDTIFFAGEALYEGDHPGTVEAAFSSGIAAANALKKMI